MADPRQRDPRTSGPRPTRRDLLLWGGGGALSALSLTGCSFFSTAPESSERDQGVSPASSKEAPEWAKLVKDGKLPPLGKRLPKEPLVVRPHERAGRYGGTWRSAMLNASDTSWLGRTVGYECPLRWDPKWEEDRPLDNVMRVEVSPDVREYTLTLREGMRWSDGKPFTADDVLFAFEDVTMNPDISPVPPQWLTADGKPATMTKVDDLQVKLVYPAPNAMAIYHLAMDSRFVRYQKEYGKRFHEKYNPNVEKEAKDAGFSDWMAYFGDRNDEWRNAGIPTLHGWVVKEPLGKGSRVVVHRNPYYWKTDPDGRQLPYIDEVVYDLITDAEVILLRGTNGELDMHTRHINTLPNKPVLARSREKGGYHFMKVRTTIMNDLVVALNLTHQDPVLRKIFQNKDFRIGLSHAIDREEMIEAIWQRQGTPWQCAPAPGSDFYDEEMGKQYTEFDLDEANRRLDAAGLTEKDSDGFRLRPDGKRLTIRIEVASPALHPFWVSGTELVARHWRKAGIDASVKNEDRSLFYERKAANQHDAGVWMGDGGLHDEMLECRWYFPWNSESIWAPLWQQYFNSRGKEGEKPPAAPLRQMQLYRELTKQPELAERQRIFREILKIAKEQFYAIGTVHIAETYGIVSNRMHNVPKEIPEAYNFSTPAPANPEQ
ncbi:MAG TPA: ABC transporter substrate-binding protein, partial [Actinopolymorphaceae bacterium]